MTTVSDSDDTVSSGGLSLELTLSGLTQELQAQRLDRTQRLARRVAAEPVFWTTTDSDVVTVGSAMILDLGSPTTGRRWVLRQIAATDGASVLTAVTGAMANWYVGRPAGVGQPVSPVQWVAHMEVLPSLQNVSNEQITVIPNDHLFVVVTGATTALQNVVAWARVLDYDMINYRSVVTI